MTPKKPGDRKTAGDLTAAEAPQYPALRWRGVAALLVTLALVLGLALFIALMREGRTTLGGISAAWAFYFLVTLRRRGFLERDRHATGGICGAPPGR